MCTCKFPSYVAYRINEKTWYVSRGDREVQIVECIDTKLVLFLGQFSWFAFCVHSVPSQPVLQSFSEVQEIRVLGGRVGLAAYWVQLMGWGFWRSLPLGHVCVFAASVSEFRRGCRG